MSRKKNRWIKSLICLLTLSSIGLSACSVKPSMGTSSSMISSSSSGETETSSRPNQEQSGGSSVPNEDSSVDSSLDAEDNIDSSNGDNGEDVVTPPSGESPSNPDEPDLGKEIIREEADALGHKIVYYSDGTWKDFGRIILLDFTPGNVESQYGYQAFKQSSNATSLCGFYEDLYDTAIEFMKSDSDVVFDGERYAIADLDCREYTLTVDETAAVWKTFQQDFPEFFWLGQSANTSYHPESGQAVFFHMTVEDSYAQGQERKRLTTAVRTMALECDTYLNGMMSLTERALTIHDYLADKMSYAYETDGVTPEDALWAHNIIGGTMGKGVCEGYAKTYAYLCGLFGLDCIVVDGNGINTNGAQAHAWNYLFLENEWRLVDVTWGDGFEKNYDALIGREWFGADALTVSKSHIPTIGGEGMGYQYPLPTLSSQRLTPVSYGELGFSEIAPTMEYAFSKMENEQGRYEMKLYPDTNVTVKNAVSIYPVGACLDIDFPKVAELRISAKRLILGEGYLMPKLSSQKAVVFNGNVHLEDISWDLVGINLQEYNLSTQGFSVELNAQNGVVGGENSSLTVHTSYVTVVTELSLVKLSVFESVWGLKLQKGGTIDEVVACGGVIWLEHAESFRVGAFIAGEETVTDVKVYSTFSSIEDYAQFTVTGECTIRVSYYLYGQIDGQWATRETLPTVLLRWGETTLSDLSIYFFDSDFDGSMYVFDRVGDYIVTETGEVVYKE